jgi:hypothetical protein
VDEPESQGGPRQAMSRAHAGPVHRINLSTMTNSKLERRRVPRALPGRHRPSRRSDSAACSTSPDPRPSELRRTGHQLGHFRHVFVVRAVAH